MRLQGCSATRDVLLFFLLELFCVLKKDLRLLLLIQEILWCAKDAKLSSLPHLRHRLWLFLQQVKGATRPLYQELDRESTYMTWTGFHSTYPTTLQSPRWVAEIIFADRQSDANHWRVWWVTRRIVHFRCWEHSKSTGDLEGGLEEVGLGRILISQDHSSLTDKCSWLPTRHRQEHWSTWLLWESEAFSGH